MLLAMDGVAADPSATPIRHAKDDGKYDERWRITADLDGDGSEDMLLSEGISHFGKLGGAWGVYLRQDGDFRRVGELTAHPLAVSIEPDRDRHQREEKDRYHARVWVYLRDSGSSGGLGYYRVGPHGVSEVLGLTIYPGDGGTDLGRAVYDAVMKHSIPFHLERSETDKRTGKVTWQSHKP